MTRAKERVRGERDYIGKRGNIWYARFQYPDPLRQAAMDLYGVDEWPAEKQWSLNTSDELTARKRVADAEKEHIYLLDFHRAHTSDKNEGTFRTVYEVEPGTNEVKPDGTHIIATNKEIIALHGGGRMETRPNPRRFEIVYQSSHSPIQRRAISVHEAAERAAYEDMDEKTLKDYIAAKEREGKLSKDDKESAKRTLREFKDHNGNKPIVECTIEDVEKFIDWILEEREPTLSRGRVLKLIAFLKAAVNLDIERRKHLSRYKSNPFAHAVVPNGDEEEAERPSYTDEDVGQDQGPPRPLPRRGEDHAGLAHLLVRSAGRHLLDPQGRMGDRW